MRKYTMKEVRTLYDCFLNDTFGDIVILGIKFRADEILKKLDPVAYETYMLDWADAADIEIKDEEVQDENRKSIE